MCITIGWSGRQRHCYQMTTKCGWYVLYIQVFFYEKWIFIWKYPCTRLFFGEAVLPRREFNVSLIIKRQKTKTKNHRTMYRDVIFGRVGVESMAINIVARSIILPKWSVGFPRMTINTVARLELAMIIQARCRRRLTGLSVYTNNSTFAIV